MSIVIHQMPQIRQTGAAGAREVCFPSEVPRCWFRLRPVIEHRLVVSQTEHGLGDGIRSFLAVKRQEAVGVIQ